MTEEQKKADETRYIIYELSGTGSLDGPYAMLGEAQKAANSLARENLNAEYGIYQKVFVTLARFEIETKGVCG